MASVYWENPNNNRYYIAVLQRDLLQDWVLSLCNGRKGTKRGRLRYRVCHTEAEGLKFIEKLKNVRNKHGYQLTNGRN
jgi:predicted DNA-binding WGR domain protein